MGDLCGYGKGVKVVCAGVDGNGGRLEVRDDQGEL